MPLRKFFAVIAAACLIFGMAGCQQNDDVLTGQADTEQTVRENQQYEVHLGETTAPENLDTEFFETEFKIDAWTMEDLAADIEIFGHNFSLPCSVSELNKDFNINYIGYDEVRNHTVADLYYENSYVSQITVDNYIDENYFKDKDIVAFFISKAKSLPQFNIMGIKNDSTLDDVIDILGEPNVPTNSLYKPCRYYFDKNKYVLIDFDENGEIRLFFIVYYND